MGGQKRERDGGLCLCLLGNVNGGMGSGEGCISEEKEESMLSMKGKKGKGDSKRKRWNIVIRCWRDWNGMLRCAHVPLVVSDH